MFSSITVLGMEANAADIKLAVSIPRATLFKNARGRELCIDVYWVAVARDICKQFDIVLGYFPATEKLVSDLD
jgi:hypothetical protein